jgi:hypothetical protein
MGPPASHHLIWPSLGGCKFPSGCVRQCVRRTWVPATGSGTAWFALAGVSCKHISGGSRHNCDHRAIPCPAAGVFTPYKAFRLPGWCLRLHTAPRLRRSLAGGSKACRTAEPMSHELGLQHRKRHFWSDEVRLRCRSAAGVGCGYRRRHRSFARVLQRCCLPATCRRTPACSCWCPRLASTAGPPCLRALAAAATARPAACGACVCCVVRTLQHPACTQLLVVRRVTHTCCSGARLLLVVVCVTAVLLRHTCAPAPAGGATFWRRTSSAPRMRSCRTGRWPCCPG